MDHLLTCMGWDSLTIMTLKAQLRTLNQLRTTNIQDLRDTSLQIGLNLGQYSELRLLKKWYTLWKKEATRNNITTNFTANVWDAFIDEQSLHDDQPAVPPTTVTGTTTGRSGNDKINSSFKVEAKEFPKLPKNTNLKGKVYNDWHDVFIVKLKQAQVGEVLESDFVMPGENDAKYG